MFFTIVENENVALKMEESRWRCLETQGKIG